MARQKRLARRPSPTRLTGRIAVLAVTLAAAVCVPPTASGASAGPPDRGFDVHPDIAYAPAEPAGSRGHLLDLYVPRRPGGGPRPLLVVTGGSGWLGDDGKYYAPELAPHFTDAGYVVAGVSTRSSTQAPFPAQVHDVKAAIRWLRAHAHEYGIDPSRFAVMGDSSGGWTAAMAGVTGGVPSLEGDVGVTGPSSAVQAVVDLYGPTDFLRMNAHMLPGACDSFNERFGLEDCHDDPRSPESLLVGCAIRTCPEKARAANPVAYVGEDTPPFLIAHGREDRLVPHHQSELLYEALAEACGDAVFYSVPGVGHDKGIVAEDVPRPEVRSTRGCRNGVAAGPRGARPTLETIEAFLDAALDRSGSRRGAHAHGP